MMKLKKRIQKRNNYYLSMTEEGDEVHITNYEGHILFSATMLKEGQLKCWRGCDCNNLKKEVQQND